MATRFNSDLISGRRCTRYTGNASPLRVSLPKSLPRSGYALSPLPFSSSPANDLLSVQLRWTPPHWRHALPPTLSSYAEGECTHACTHALTRLRSRVIAAQVQRVHHAYTDDDVRGICTWRYAHVRAPTTVQYIHCHDEEGESDSWPLESARIRTATCEILRTMESILSGVRLHLTPREATANNYRRWFTAP